MLNGWSPSFETVYEYDGDRLVRSVTRQIEPEFDDATRDLVEGLARYDQETCPGCGLHESIHSDPASAFTFEDTFCEVCKGKDVYGRILADRDDDATPKGSNGQPVKQEPTVERPGDGRHVHLRRMSAAEVEERRAEQAAKTRARGRH